ncbi:MAG: hypothetical protein AAF127_04330 [Pseudomonadota bacterium]
MSSGEAGLILPGEGKEAQVKNILSEDKSSSQNATNGPHKSFSSNAIYLARTAQINTLTLSQMADNKASILIGATFVVFSLAVTKLIGAELTWAILALAITAFVASLCAVFAVLPASKG